TLLLCLLSTCTTLFRSSCLLACLVCWLRSIFLCWISICLMIILRFTLFVGSSVCFVLYISVSALAVTVAFDFTVSISIAFKLNEYHAFADLIANCHANFSDFTGSRAWYFY